MPFGGIACRGEGQEVFFDVQLHRRKEGIDPFDESRVARLRGVLKGGIKGAMVFGDIRRGEAKTEVISHARFAGRVDLFLCEFGNKNARFHAAASFEADLVCRSQKLFDAIEHVKIDYAGKIKTFLFGQPGKFGGGIAVSVVGIKSVGVLVDDSFGRAQRDIIVFDMRLKHIESGCPFFGIERVEFCFQQFNVLLFHQKSFFETPENVSSGF